MQWPIENFDFDDPEISPVWDNIEEMFPPEVRSLTPIGLFIIRVAMDQDEVGGFFMPASIAVAAHNPESSDPELKEADAELCCHAAAEIVRHAGRTMGLEKAFQEIQKILQATRNCS